MSLVVAGAVAGLTTHQFNLLVATLGALVWGALPLAAASAGDLLKLGDAAFANGDMSAAIRHYTSALDLDPSTAIFYSKRAAAYVSLKKYAQALKDLDRAVDVDSSFTQGYLSRGKLHRCAQVEWPETAWQLSKSVSVHALDIAAARAASKPHSTLSTAWRALPPVVTPHLKPALCDCMRRFPPRRKVCSLSSAKSDFEAVIKLRPTHSQAPKELKTLSELQSAVDELERLSEQAADQQVQPDAARELLQRVYKVAPDCIPAQLLEAKLEMSQGNYEQVRGHEGLLLHAGLTAGGQRQL